MKLDVNGSTRAIWDFLKEHPGKTWTASMIADSMGIKNGGSGVISSLRVIANRDKRLKHVEISQYRHGWIYEGTSKAKDESHQLDLSSSTGLDDVVRSIMQLVKAVEAQTDAMINTGIILK